MAAAVLWMYFFFFGERCDFVRNQNHSDCPFFHPNCTALKRTNEPNAWLYVLCILYVCCTMSRQPMPYYHIYQLCVCVLYTRVLCAGVYVCSTNTNKAILSMRCIVYVVLARTSVSVYLYCVCVWYVSHPLFHTQ